MRFKTLVALFSLITCFANAQSFHERVKATYNFTPSELSDTERQKKSDILDSLWSYVKGDTEAHLPELRKELKTSDDNNFFYFDGSQLLLSLTNIPGDLEIAYKAVKKCDIASIQGGPYVEMLHLFAAHGYNTTDEALKIIDAKNFSAYFPMHVMTLEKNLSLMFSLTALDNKIYLDKILDKLKKITDTADIKQVIDFLSYVCDCRADSAIKACVNNMSLPASLRIYAKEDMVPDTVKTENNAEKFKKLLEERKKNLTTRGVSDEALDDIVQETAEMKKYYKCTEK